MSFNNVLCCTLGQIEGNRWTKILSGLKQEGVIKNYIRLGAVSGCEYQENDLLYGDIQNYQYTGKSAKIAAAMWLHFPTFLSLQSRLSKKGDIRNRYISFTPHAYINYFYMLCDYFANILSSHQIDLVIFNTAPHLGMDYVLYQVAKKMNIKVLTFWPAFYPNRFFYLQSLEECGSFDSAMADSSAPFIKLPRTFEHNWFYMEEPALNWFGSKLSYAKSWAKQRAKIIIRLIKHNFFNELIEILNSLSMEIRQKRYIKHYKQYFKNTPDFDEPYVYFPLHLQPDQPASTFAGEYCDDQIKAIEQLSTVLPEDWKIYVKENPKQNLFARDPYFFQRLKAIKNVYFIPKSVSTSKLAMHSKFVATIGGTAAWESICGGKPALIFGYAWYSAMPGIFKFSPDFNVTELMAYKIDHQVLEEEFNSLLEKTKPGMISHGYEKIIENYSDEKNTQLLIKSIGEIIEHISA